MAPSPQVGQPKAPDKTSNTLQQSSSGLSNEIYSTSSLSSASTSTATCYHQYTISTSMTNTTTTQSLSGTLVFPSTVAGSTSNSIASSNLNTTTFTSAGSTNSNINTEKPSTSNAKNIKNLNDFEENQLKELLDEAYSYKNPKDRENKSEMFKQLLQKVEREKDESSFSFRALTTRYTRGSNSHKHGGSLQDLVEAAQNDCLLDNDYNSYGTRNKRHHHNSRQKKFSSVSSRQREGGSLPSNVNVSNCNLSVYEQPFFNEVSKRRGKSERTCSGTSCTSGTSATSSTVSTCGYESLNSSISQSKEDSHFSVAAPGDTIIDMGDNFSEDTQLQHHLASESLAQGLSEPLEYDDGIELSVASKKISCHPNSITNSSRLEITCLEPKNWVDEKFLFTQTDGIKKTDLSCLPFDESYRCCNSVLGDKSDSIKPPVSLFSQSKISSSKQLDENGNALNPSYSSSNQSQLKLKKKKFQSDRNTKNLTVQSLPGYRGEESVEELVKFIENSNSKKSEKNTKQEGKKKDKKKEKDKDKEEKKKLKKSNSLEELRSCTKLDEDEKCENQVTMRIKGKKNNEKPSVLSNAEAKESLKQNNKRGERRSWGTEELSYLGETNPIEEVREKVKEKDKLKKVKDSKEIKENKEFKEHKEQIDFKDISEKIEKLEKVEKVEKIEKVEKVEKVEKSEKSDKIEKNEKVENKKKKYEQPLFVVSMESVQNESAEFHVVTKKKKPRKRQTLDGVRQIKQSSSSTRNDNSITNTKKYQSSSHFTNDRDLYLKSLNANESRRKSTSSVPPSEKSDSSDLDSVHSLPVEPSSSRHMNKSSVTTTIAASSSSMSLSSSFSQAQVPQSYADIARIVNKVGNTVSFLSSPLIEKFDKRQSGSMSSPGTNMSGGNLGDGNVVSIISSSSLGLKKLKNKDFPDLISDKSNNTDGGSSCSSTSSTSTIVKQITYSQTLGDEKLINDNTVNSKSSKLIDVLKSKESGKQQQLLKKSKSIESENYYNIDQYPALEKTVKKHIQQNIVSNSATAISVNQIQPNVGNTKHQRSHSLQSSTINQTINVTNVVTNSNQTNYQHNNASNIVTANVSICEQQQSKEKSKEFCAALNHVLDPNINTNSNSAPTSYSSSLEKITSNTVSITKPHKHTETISPLVELNNAKNKQHQIINQSQNIVEVATNVNIANKKVKSDIFQLPNGKKNKKDKNNQNAVNNNTDITGIADFQQFPPLISMSTNNNNKQLNRPAVIILNDSNENCIPISNDFTFGDFNEEEIRLFESHLPLDDSSQFNVASYQINNGNLEDIHLSPHDSDNGYSSSNNRSILSESTEGTSIIITPTTLSSSNSLINSIATVHTDPNVIQGTMNIVDATTMLVDPKQIQCPIQDGFYIGKISSIASNSVNTQTQTIYYQQQPQPPPPIQIGQHQQQQPTILRNLGTNVVVVPIALGSIAIPTVQAPINLQNNSKNNSNDINTNPYSNSDIKIIEVVNCQCSKNNINSNNNENNINNNDTNINEQCEQITISSEKIEDLTKTKTNNENEIENNLSISADKMNNNISVENNETNCQQQTLKHSEHQEASSKISNSDNTSNNPCVNFSPTLLSTLTSSISKTGVSSLLESSEISLPNSTTETTNTNSVTNLDYDKKKLARKEINVRFIAPPVTNELNSINYEKIVDFVGLAWQEISGTSRGAQFYNGQ